MEPLFVSPGLILAHYSDQLAKSAGRSRSAPMDSPPQTFVHSAGRAQELFFHELGDGDEGPQSGEEGDRSVRGD